MTTFHTAVAVAFVVLLAGCETFVDADPADVAPTLAVQGLFDAGRPWSIYVTRTVPLNSGIYFGFSPITDADVTITADDGTVVTLPLRSQSGLYGAERLLGADGSYPDIDDPQYEDGPGPEAGRTWAGAAQRQPGAERQTGHGPRRVRR